MADEWDKYIVDNQSQGGDNWDSYIVDNAQSVATPNNQGSSVGDLVGGVAGLAGAGLAAYGVGKGIKQIPSAYNKFRGVPERNRLLNQARNLQSELGQTGMQYTDLPRLVNDKITNLKQAAKDFDNTIAKAPVNKMIETVQQGYEPFYGSAYKAYGEGMQGLDTLAEKAGVKLDTAKFKQEVVDPILSKYEGSYEVIKNPELAQKVDALKGKILDQFGQDAPKELKVSEAKQIYKIIQEDLPKNSQHKIAESWGKFLEKNTTGDIQSQLKELNSNYADIAKSRNQINKYYDPSKGVFNKEGLARYYSNYLKNKFDTGVQELTNLFAKGNKLAQPMEGVGDAFSKLEDIKINQATKLIDNLKVWSSKLQESKNLVAKLKTAQKRVDNRSISKVVSHVPFVGALGRVVSKGVPALGMAGNIADAFKFSKDPQAYIYQLQTGEDIAPVRAVEQKIKSGQELSPEEMFIAWKNKQLI